MVTIIMLIVSAILIIIGFVCDIAIIIGLIAGVLSLPVLIFKRSKK